MSLKKSTWMSEPQWTELFDDMDNSYFEARSPYHDEGSPIMWRLRQRLAGNEIEWYEAHDAELMDVLEGTWKTIEEAKQAIAEAHQNIISDTANELLEDD